MSRNRRRHNHTNKVPIGAFSPWLLVSLIFLAGGMTWVYFKNQQVAAGNEQRQLERQLAELRTQNSVLKAHIATLSSLTALQKRLDDGYIAMVPISGTDVVRIDFNQAHQRMASNGRLNGEVRPVANQGGGR